MVKGFFDFEGTLTEQKYPVQWLKDVISICQEADVMMEPYMLTGVNEKKIEEFYQRYPELVSVIPHEKVLYMSQVDGDWNFIRDRVSLEAPVCAVIVNDAEPAIAKIIATKPEYITKPEGIQIVSCRNMPAEDCAHQIIRIAQQQFQDGGESQEISVTRFSKKPTAGFRKSFSKDLAKVSLP